MKGPAFHFYLIEYTMMILTRRRFMINHWSPLRSELLMRAKYPSINIKCFTQGTCFDSSLVVTQKIDHLFKEILSKKEYFFNSDDDADYLIIDDALVTMSHPLIGIDIQSVAKAVMKSPALPGTRSKSMVALVTGMGRGKTRLLVELNRELKKSPGVFSMAITFNHHWDPPTSSSSELRLCNVEIKYAAAIISRVISIHYHISFDVATKMTEEFILEMGEGINAVSLIGGCIRFIVRQMRRENPNIYRFFLLVDESMKIADTLMEPDIHNILRKAMLDTELMSPDESPLVVDLVMSSLDIKATGVSDSNRVIKSISTPTQLNVDEVLEKWVKRHLVISDVPLTGNMDPEVERSMLKLKCLISCVSPVPRAIQCLITALSEIGNISTLDASMVKFLYDSTMEAVLERYPTSILLPPKYAKALLFGEKIYLDDTVMLLIKESVFVNSLTSLSRSMRVLPESSIVSMHRLDTQTDEFAYSKVIVDTIKSLLDNLVNSTGIEDAGKPLEIITRGLIDARLRVLVDLDAIELTGQIFCLKSFLQIHNVDKIVANSRMVKLLITPDFVVNLGRIVSAAMPCSNDFSVVADRHRFSDVARDFLEAANSAILEPDDSYMKLNVDPRECVDGMWILRRRGRDPFILAVDCKSRQIDKPTRHRSTKNTHLADDLPGRGSQAQHFLNVVKEAQAWSASEVQNGSMLDAMRRGNFLYVYLSTQADSTFAVGDHILHLGSADSERFLSFFKSYYLLHRPS